MSDDDIFGFCDESTARQLEVELQRRQQVFDQLRQIIDPDLRRDVVSLNFIKRMRITPASMAVVSDTTENIDSNNASDHNMLSDVSFDFELTTPACPVKDDFERECKRLVSELPWVKRVYVRMTAQERQDLSATTKDGLSGVSHVIAVASCKGGVGKSTVCVNLAFALARLGARVGIADCDVYGPSLNTLVQVVEDKEKESQIRSDGDLLIPLEHNGVKLMSYGFIRPDDFAAMRGPLASGSAVQMVTGTKWGSLDYLLLDLPPGTGDVHLSLAQSVPIRGAVMVTTPQQLAVVDVEKGIKFFEELRIPTMALVENMAYFMCDGCDKKHFIFHRDEKGLQRIDKLLSSSSDGQQRFMLPLHTPLAIPTHTSVTKEADERGLAYPYVSAFDAEVDNVSAEFKKIAQSVARQASSLQFLKRIPSVFAHNRHKKIFLVYHHASTSNTEIKKQQEQEQRQKDRNRVDENILGDWENLIEDGNDNSHRKVTIEETRTHNETGCCGGKNKKSDGQCCQEEDGIECNDDDHDHDHDHDGDEDEDDDEDNEFMGPADEIQETLEIPYREVRLNCRCAECVDEITGQPKLDPKKVPMNVSPLSLSAAGNLAIDIKWSDNHESLMTFSALESIARNFENLRPQNTSQAQAMSLLTLAANPNSNSAKTTTNDQSSKNKSKTALFKNDRSGPAENKKSGKGGCMAGDTSLDW